VEGKGIVIKSSREIELMREAGRVVAQVLERLKKEAAPGRKTGELDGIAAEEIARRGARSSFLGYRNYPAHICTSVNNEVVHGIPGDRVLQEGDIISLDVGAILEGFQGDAAITVGVGKVSEQAGRLLGVTQGALETAIRRCRRGQRLGDVSFAIQKYVEERGFSVVREYSGHGIGRELHEEPQIPNFGLPGQGPLLRRGMALALEPMVNAGGWRTRLDTNGWTVLTDDGGLSAHFEHTVAITDGDAEVLTVL
jgi:methionyl aminopeptidase